ncbi:putative pectinesterase inhibitor domain, Cell wall/vacuolar inhibitor of fructosidase [Medicago truncatula]|nr:putative pectinesterase inhibitor domain, Cell wall/vacuolar inhibitor of fructosidase [Medicago truncatula]
MKKMKLITIFLEMATFIILIPSVQSTLSHTSLLEQICRQSPHYHLCTMTLRSSINHRSKEDIAGFARLTLEIVKANASLTLEHVQKGYIQQTNGLEQKRAMRDCIALYNMIVNVHLREALNAMEKYDYKIVKQRVYAASIQAEICENKFKNSLTKPLKDTNRYVQNLCIIAASIVNKLLLQNHLTSAY